MTTHDLEPTQRLPEVARQGELADVGLPEAPRRTRIGGALVRALLLALVGLGALVAAALLLTPIRESVLILGSDARPDELARGEVGRTDTLLLLVADRATPRLAMVSVPRDLWVAIPGFGEERINTAYEIGGSQTAKQTVSNLLAQRIDRYAVVGLQGVRDMVDALGGVDVTVAQAIHDDAYPTDDYGYQTVDIPAGRQHMDGDTTLKYARTRHQDSDFGRSARQQQVLAAVRAAMLNPLNWPRVPAVLTAASHSIKTDVTPFDAIAIGAAMLRDPGDPDRLVIDTTLVSPVTGQDGASLLRAGPDLKSAVARFLGGASSARVQVLNGAGVAGLAARTADRLAQSGFVIAGIGDASKAQSQTSILAKPGARSVGDAVANALNLPASRVSDSSTPSEADVQVILGADAR
jgi:LCP family protein required for cell wall assembly